MEETQVVITTYRGPPATVKGLHANHCHCGDHVWCLPYNESLARWQSYQLARSKTSSINTGWRHPCRRQRITSSCVIMASPEDADLLRERKWRPMPTKVRTRHKVELKGGSRRGLTSTTDHGA